MIAEYAAGIQSEPFADHQPEIRALRQLHAGFEQASESEEGHPVIRIVEKTRMESHRPEHLHGIESAFRKEGRNRAKRARPDIAPRRVREFTTAPR